MAMEHSPNSEAKVLIVDDEDGIRSILRRVLLRSGVASHLIREAPNAEAALEILAGEQFNIILSDYRMGAKTGVELLTWVYQNSPSTVRVLMTGYNEEAIAVEAINSARVDAYVKKPWDNAKLADTVQELLRLQRANQQKEAAVQRGIELSTRTKASDKGTIRRL